MVKNLHKYMVRMVCIGALAFSMTACVMMPGGTNGGHGGGGHSGGPTMHP